MAILTVETLNKAGLDPTLVAATETGDAFLNNDRTFFIALNSSAGSIDITFVKKKDELSVSGYGELALADNVVAVGAGKEKFIPAPPAIYNDGDGKVEVTYSAHADLTVGAVKLGSV